MGASTVRCDLVENDNKEFAHCQSALAFLEDVAEQRNETIADQHFHILS